MLDIDNFVFEAFKSEYNMEHEETLYQENERLAGKNCSILADFFQDFFFVNLPQAVVVTSDDYKEVFFVNQKARHMFFLQSKDEFDEILENLYVIEVSQKIQKKPKK